MEQGADPSSPSLLHYYVINRGGTDYALYEGLLGEAHRLGLRGIRTRLLQSPTPANGHVAICVATVITAAGEFTATGAAGPAPTASGGPGAAGSAETAPAPGGPAPPGAPPGARTGPPPGRTLIQLAEARAKAGALRDALNLDVVPLEELDVAEPGGDA